MKESKKCVFSGLKGGMSPLRKAVLSPFPCLYPDYARLLYETVTGLFSFLQALQNHYEKGGLVDGKRNYHDRRRALLCWPSSQLQGLLLLEEQENGLRPQKGELLLSGGSTQTEVPLWRLFIICSSFSKTYSNTIEHLVQLLIFEIRYRICFLAAFLFTDFTWGHRVLIRGMMPLNTCLTIPVKITIHVYAGTALRVI